MAAPEDTLAIAGTSTSVTTTEAACTPATAKTRTTAGSQETPTATTTSAREEPKPATESTRTLLAATSLRMLATTGMSEEVISRPQMFYSQFR
jgi:hypothetical protein